MGLLFTTEGTRRIINTLNTAFDGPDPTGKFGLAYIRGLWNGATPNTTVANYVNNGWAPSQLATALDLLPYDQGTGEGRDRKDHNPPNTPTAYDVRHAKRWIWFLQNVLGSNAAAPTFNTIMGALQHAIKNDVPDPNSPGKTLDIQRVSFDHVELDANSDSPGSSPPSAVIFDAPLLDNNGKTTGYVRHVTLLTQRVKESEPGTNPGSAAVSNPPWHQPPS
jgi:hypothetical protein